jgi:GntR family transcriptional regulator
MPRRRSTPKAFPVELAPGRTRREPLYERVKAQLVKSVADGEWQPGEAIPSERALATRYGVGIATIRTAVGALVSARVLDRIQGKGTFVSLHGQDRNIYQFFRVARDDGVKEYPKSQLLSFQKTTADAQTADLLQLPRTKRGTEVFKLRTVLSVHGVAIVVSDIAVPAVLFRGLTADIIRTGGDTMYAVYQQQYGINIIRTTERLWARKADRAIAKLLGLSPGDAIIDLHRIAYTFSNKPVEVRRSRIKTDDYHYLFDEGPSF